MERITNVRISTLTKSVSHDGDVSIVSVGLNNGHVFAVDNEGNTHDMGAIIISNIEIATPQVASEGCGCNTPNANVIAKLLRGVDGVDGITPDMSDYYDKGQVDEKLSHKQDAISDIDNIRSNALKGATALQSVPSEYVTETELQNKGYATTTQVYAKQDKISDLDAIRQGAAKGATAVQPSDVDSEVSETSTNPVQNKAVAGTFNEIVGLLDASLSMVGEKINSKQDKLVSGENIKSINGESIIGEGNIEIEGGGGSSEYESNIEDKTLAMPNAVGGIAKGTTISALEGKTYNEMFDDLLFPTVNPTFTKPSASIAFKSNYSSTQEVGATGPTVSNFTVGYNAGAITLNGVKQANRGGTQNTANSFIYVNGSASNKTLPSKVTLGSTTFKYRAAYAAGPQPKNNKGGNYSSPLAAGTVDSSAITLNGTYPWYASTSSATSTNPVVKQSLVAWDTTAGKMVTGEFTVQPSGTLPQVFKLPRQIKTLQLKNALNGQMEDVANIATDYTESTETINIGGTNVTYYVYTYKGSTRGSVTLLAKF